MLSRQWLVTMGLFIIHADLCQCIILQLWLASLGYRPCCRDAVEALWTICILSMQWLVLMTLFIISADIYRCIIPPRWLALLGYSWPCSGHGADMLWSIRFPDSDLSWWVRRLPSDSWCIILQQWFALLEYFPSPRLAIDVLWYIPYSLNTVHCHEAFFYPSRCFLMHHPWIVSCSLGYRPC